ERNPEGKTVHQERLLNTAHIVAVQEQFFTDQKLGLSLKRGTLIKMFGQEPAGVKETVAEVQALIEGNLCDG
ncbi:hypothetical protein N9878_01170, partial [bacterium]|nr:hypothetical protein [bacterium]